MVLWFVLSYPSAGAGAEIPARSVHWNTNSTPPAVEVTGIGEKALGVFQGTNWQTDDWQKLLSVYAGQNVPPMLGSYEVAGRLIRFKPKFPLEPGVIYQAVLRPAALREETDARAAELTATFQLPGSTRSKATIITQIYPTASLLPENLLKFYLHFSAPMSRGHTYEHIHLLNEAHKPVELPFLELDQELWNPEMTRLTLLMDPGRIKRGVRPLEEIGPALEAGKGYTLVIDRDWQDAEGNPLKDSYRKPFKAGPPIRESLDTATWQILAPPAKSFSALRIRFPGPLDHALAQRMIQVVDSTGQVVPGVASLRDSERQWEFAPAKGWVAGRYRVAIQRTIEDLAGNNIGKAFEVDLFEGVKSSISNATVSLEFEVK